MHDTKFIRAYKQQLLSKISDRYDCAYITENWGRDRFTDYELEKFRNSCAEHVERIGNGRFPQKVFRGSYAPTLNELAAHMITQRQRTIFTTSNDSQTLLLMLADIDNKHGKGDADAAAAYLSERYLNGRSFIEPSTKGLGRHVYFLLDVAGMGRNDLYQRVGLLADQIKSDQAFQRFGVSFDQVFYGLPTIWSNTVQGWKIVKRGDLLKLPYLTAGQADLDRLMTLPVWSAYDLFPASKGECHTHIALTIVGGSGASQQAVVQKGESKQHLEASAIDDAYTKKRLCVDRMLQKTKGRCSLEEVLTDYLTNWNPSVEGDDDLTRHRRQKKLAVLLEQRRKTFCAVGWERSFRRDEYLNQITAAVPADAFQWHRRESLNHRRLSDFISIKLQDAFFNKEWFARASRDATIQNSRIMKKKNLIDWTLNAHTYKRLLQLATTYGFLCVYEEYDAPTRTKTGKKVFKGRPRLIGPGDAVPTLKAEWLKLYTAYKTKSRTSAAA